MKVLLVNKFLYPKGGSETYILKLGEILRNNGHEVWYFGLENEKNTVGNGVDSYVSDIDFAKGVAKNLKAPFRIIYSSEARKKIRRVLDEFKPDVVHLNNIQFHLTPSIILEIENYRRQNNKELRIVYTAHDYQLICPSHGLFDNNLDVCENCLGGNYLHCIKKKCVKNSRAKSILATMDAYLWRNSKAYDYVDAIICPSEFLKRKLDSQSRFVSKTTALHNFIEDEQDNIPYEKKGYILEFGHLSKDKGTLTLLDAAKRMGNIRFVFAGYGAAVEEIKKVPNAEYVGFKTGAELKKLIGEALCTVCPSEMYENCPYSVMESIKLSTPVVGANIGGIPELIDEGSNGLLFTAGDSQELEQKLRYLAENHDIAESFSNNCKTAELETTQSYFNKLMEIYNGNKSFLS